MVVPAETALGLYRGSQHRPPILNPEFQDEGPRDFVLLKRYVQVIGPVSNVLIVLAHLGHCYGWA